MLFGVFTPKIDMPFLITIDMYIAVLILYYNYSTKHHLIMNIILYYNNIRIYEL